MNKLIAIQHSNEKNYSDSFQFYKSCDAQQSLKMKALTLSKTKKQQKGVVMVVSLILLLIVSLITMTTLTTAGLEEKMAINAQIVNQAFQAAETGLSDILQDRATRFAAVDQKASEDFPVTKRNIGVGDSGTSYADVDVIFFSSNYDNENQSDSSQDLSTIGTGNLGSGNFIRYNLEAKSSGKINQLPQVEVNLTQGMYFLD